MIAYDPWDMNPTSGSAPSGYTRSGLRLDHHDAEGFVTEEPLEPLVCIRCGALVLHAQTTLHQNSHITAGLQ